VSTTEKLRAVAESTGGSSKRLGDPIGVPRILAMRESPIYAGAGFIAVKRTGASALIGVSRRPLAEGFGGLIVLVGALIVMWLTEGGRRFGRGGGKL
jgi:hypothetical protein